MTPVRLEPAALWSRVKHSTTEPLRSRDLLKNVKIGQDQLQLIMGQILFYHIWGLQPFRSSYLNNLMNNPSNSPVIFEKKIKDVKIGMWQSK